MKTNMKQLLASAMVAGFLGGSTAALANPPAGHPDTDAAATKEAHPKKGHKDAHHKKHDKKHDKKAENGCGEGGSCKEGGSCSEKKAE